jgi:hypothetical protein
MAVFGGALASFGGCGAPFGGPMAVEWRFARHQMAVGWHVLASFGGPTVAENDVTYCFCGTF